MKLIEMKDMIDKVVMDNEHKYALIGVRYENKAREIGEALEWSKHNEDREDEREFPEYGSEEYDELPELEGTSVWSASSADIPGYGKLREADYDRNAVSRFEADHCYIVAGNRQGVHDCPDDGEILIKDAVVIAVVF